MDIPQLAEVVTKFLAPFLPYLIAGTNAAAQEAGKLFTKAAWDKAQELWGRLKPKVDSSPVAQKTIEDARLNEIEKSKGNPDNLRAQVKLEALLETTLEADEDFLRFVQAGDYSIVVGGNVENSIVLNNSNNNKIIGNIEKYYESAPPAESFSALASVEELTREYLQALIADCEKLPLGAIHVTLEKAEHEASISLEDVYIDLDIHPRLRGKDAMSLRGEAEAIHVGTQDEREPQRIPIAEALTDENLRRIVLLGKAGSGKTTCVHYLTIALASLHQNITTKKPLPEGSTLARYFPIRLILRDVAAGYISSDTKTGGVDILWNALRGDLAKKIGSEQADLLFPHLQKRIKTTPCLIMLDGLDEVPESEDRRPRLLEAIGHFAAPLRQSIVMVTARPYAYDNPKWHLPHFEVIDLLDFSSEQIENFISRFYDSVRAVKNWDDDFAESRKKELNEAVQGREYLYKLAERPLLLTLIASVDSSGSKLPEDRAELYKQTIDLMLQRWQQRKENSLAEKEIVKFFSTDTGKVLDILQKLAYKVHERQGRESKPKEDAPADIERDEIWGAFSQSLPKEVDTESLLNFLEKRAGLLLDQGEGVYVFPHRSFQEYLAAGFLNMQSDERFHLDFVFRSGPKWWREVVLLGIARLLSGSLKNAADEVSSLVPCDIEEIEQEITPTDWQAAALAGESLIEIRLKERGGDQVKYKTIIKRVANWLAQLLEQNALTPRERAEAGNTLARLSDPRPGVINDFLFCEIPAGKFWMGSKKEDDPLSDEREYPQFEYNIPYNYCMSRYPITNAQFDLFVKDPNGYTNDALWTKAGLDWRKDRKEHNRYGGAFSLSNHPVVGVSWYEAIAFCKWLTGQMQVISYELQVYDPKTRVIRADDNLKSSIVNRKFEIRLPSEAEWEKAARATRGRVAKASRYPWGDEITPDHANYGDTNLNVTSAVGAFPLGMNDYGLLDMSGNVWEWCATEWQENYEDYLKKENNKPEGDSLRVVRGGAFSYLEWGARCAYRYWVSPYYWYWIDGFRVVVSPVFH